MRHACILLAKYFKTMRYFLRININGVKSAYKNKYIKMQAKEQTHTHIRTYIQIMARHIQTAETKTICG